MGIAQRFLAEDILLPDVLLVSRKMVVQEVAQLMNRYNIGSVMVIDDEQGRQKPVGIFTERDLLKRVIAKDLDPTDVVVEEVMTNEILYAKATDDVWDLLKVMGQNQIRHLPVEKDGKLLGIISLKDVCEHVLQLQKSFEAKE